jgi:hypothetical protein
MDSAPDDRALPRPGFPIRRSPDQRPLSGSPKLIAASHVLPRLLAPRHPPCALSSLTMLADRHPLEERTSDRKAWQSHHALALAHCLPVQIVKELRAPCTAASQDAATCGPRCGLRPRSRAGHRPSHGADGDRTHDLRLAKPALSRLSYSPDSLAHRNQPAALCAREGGTRRPTCDARRPGSPSHGRRPGRCSILSRVAPDSQYLPHRPRGRCSPYSRLPSQFKPGPSLRGGPR